MQYASETFFLYGPPATGKSTCAKNLAAALGKRAVDLDSLIEARVGMSIPAYVAQAGREAFRDAETATLEALCAEAPNAVVALGGGALLRAQNRAMVEACGPVVCIQTPPAELARRVERKAGSRPFSADAAALLKTLEERKEHYASFRLQVAVDGIAPPQEVWPRVLAAFGIYLVSGMGAPYTVRVAPGAIELLGGVIARLEPRPRHLLLVGDSNTLPLYRARVEAALGEAVACHEIPAGEEHKTLATVEGIWGAMLRAGIERGDLVLALGGGVVGDLTGFAAATWLRGVRWLNMPTSLLAMVDAGVGGKTGADLKAGKNLIGAFHPPCAVLSDTNVLSTLPERELRCGLAETYKHAMIGDPGLAELLARFGQARGSVDYLTELVVRSVGVKVRTILADPFERTGLRAALNLGHTVGHAVEAASGFAVAHGEAVAIGTVAAARLAEGMDLAREAGLSARVKAGLEALGLPTEIPAGYDAATLKDYLSHDKKKAAGVVRFALPVAFGEVRTGCTVREEVLDEVLAGQRL
ncbi:MAG: 3-dehydroquinate synthase [Candidatus Spyradenecus sp.]